MFANPVEFGELSGGSCKECNVPLAWIHTLGEIVKEEICIGCGAVYGSQEDGHLERPEQYGRAPTHAAVLWNNLGTVPGPEMSHQVMSALNQDPRTYNGLKFQAAKCRLLASWRSTNNGNTDDRTKQIFADMIKTVENKRRLKLPEQRVAALGALISKCVKRGETIKRMTSAETRRTIESLLVFEELWPP